MTSREDALRLLRMARAANELAASVGSNHDAVRPGRDQSATERDRGSELLEQSDEAPLVSDSSESVRAGSADGRTGSPNYVTPTAFITWAHGGPAMSASDGQEWERQVAEFATAMRQVGVDVDVDLYHLDDVAVDWTRYGPGAIKTHDFVFIVLSSAWSERWEGRNKRTEGAGAAVEADALKGLFNQNQTEFQRRVKVILLPGQATSDLPHELHRLVRYRVDPAADPDSTLNLVRALTGQPSYVKPPLGAIPSLPPAFEETLSSRKPESARSESRDLQAVSAELKSLDRLIARALGIPRARVRNLSPDDLGGRLKSKDQAHLTASIRRRATLQGMYDAMVQGE